MIQHSRHANARRASTTLLAGAMALMGALEATPARAQDALGSGQALDANSLVGSNGRNRTNARADFAREIQLRNAIVTGNAPDGRSFRGDVGYIASDDFRGALGSNDLFQFNRDSIYSTLATQNVRGIQALRFGLGQSVANQTDEGIGGGLIVSRSQAATTAGQETRPGGASTLEIDPFGHLEGAMRSTTEFQIASNRFPRILDSYRGRDGMPTYVTGTGLLGVRPVRAANSIFDIAPLSFDVRKGGALDAERLDADPEQINQGLGAQLEDESTRAPGLSDRVTTRVEPVSMHEVLIESLRENASVSDELRITGFQIADDAEEGEDDAEEDPDASSIRQAPSQPVPLAPIEPTEGADDSPSDPFRLELDRIRERLERGQRPDPLGELLDDGRDDPNAEADEDADGEDEGDEDEEREDSREFIREARDVLGGGDGAQRLETLIAEAGVEDIYGLHMKRGQELLSQDRWFDAEERFSAALRARRGDAMAAAGRVSAQIGAGMVRSASINLRNLLTAYPEMIQVQLGQSLFPRGERLVQIKEQLIYRAERGTDVSRNAAFLLTYVGFESGDSQSIARGFELMRQLDRDLAEELGAPVQQMSELELLLEELWLGQ